MFGIFSKFVCFAIVILFFVGCGVSSVEDGGFDPTETLVLDGQYESSVTLEVGETFALDMLIPLEKGYRIVGASFDPDMLGLEHYLEYNDEGARRAVYMFTTLVKGMSDVLVKMKPLSGGGVDIYKQVSVKVGGDDGFF